MGNQTLTELVAHLDKFQPSQAVFKDETVPGMWWPKVLKQLFFFFFFFLELNLFNVEQKLVYIDGHTMYSTYNHVS